MFYEKLEEKLHERGVKKSELAKKLDISQQTIQNWKKGSYPDCKKIKIICEFLNISADYLLEINPKNGNTTTKPPNLEENIKLTHEERLLIDYYRQADNFDQKSVLQIAQRGAERQENNRKQKKSLTSPEKVS